MKSFKKYLEEKTGLAALAAMGVAGGAMAAPPKPEATQHIIDYMKEKEGFRPVAEPDKDAQGNPIVVGYGTTHVYPDTGKPIKAGETITPERAEELMRASIEKDVTPKMERIPGWDKMDAGKQAALLSFAYNLGQNFYGGKNFAGITDALKNERWQDVPAEMAKYNKGINPKTGKREALPGLVTRRAEEGKLWTEGLPGAEKPKVEEPETEEKPETDKTKPPASTTYTVKAGDTLSAIAKAQGRKLQDLLSANPEIKDPNKIKPGQQIK